MKRPINRKQKVKSKQNDTGTLLAQCKKGNSKAQMQLYRQFSGAMYNTAFRILGNADDAEDALQEGFITAFDKLEEVQEEEKFPGWIKTIVLRKALTHLERKKKTIPLHTEMQLQKAEEESQKEEISTQKTFLWNSLQQLKPNHKNILILLYYEGMDYEEISEIMGLSYSNCRTLASRAKEHLKKIVKNTAHVS